MSLFPREPISFRNQLTDTDTRSTCFQGVSVDKNKKVAKFASQSAKSRRILQETMRLVVRTVSFHKQEVDSTGVQPSQEKSRYPQPSRAASRK